MNSDRGAKRRKLDTIQQSASTDTPDAATAQAQHAAFNGADLDPQLHAPSQPTSEGTNGNAPVRVASGVKTKAKAPNKRGRKSAGDADAEMGVYEDIEGAHPPQSPVNKRKGVAFTSNPPKKRQLDPLRNQRAEVGAPPPKGGTCLGFFKQFHQPKDAAKGKGKGKGKGEVEGEAVGGVDGGEVAVVQPKKRGRPPKKKEAVVEQAVMVAPAAPVAQMTGEDEGDTVHVRPAKERWTYEDGPKKSLEDEIRDLENAARNNTADAGEENGITKKSGRASAANAKDLMHASVKKNKAAQPRTTKRPTAAERRKANRVDHMEGDEGTEVEGEVDGQASAPDEVPMLNRDGTNHAAPVRQVTIPAKAKAQPRKPVAPTYLAEFDSEHLEAVQSILMEKLTGKRVTSPKNLEDEQAKVASVIEQTITAGESNSMVLIGSRGSGKTALVNFILREQAIEHPNEFHVVRLNGFTHTDDKIALREIWRQLGREMDLDEEENASKSFADTLARLLALLSHPAELGQEQQIDHITKSVIFVLDEFDHFAQHPRQTLLYNLFDIAQSRKAPIAVLGLTTRIDAAESLEKRVKSRFSHRHVHLSLAKSFAAYQEACKAALVISEDDLAAEDAAQLPPTAATSWNTFIDDFLSQDPTTHHLRRLYYTTKSIPDFHTSMLTPLSTIPTRKETHSTTADLLTHLTTALTNSSTLAAPDSRLALLPTLSTLHLALLIAAARLTAIHSHEVVPFAQAYEEYKLLASKAKLQASASGAAAAAQGAGAKVWGKEVARGAWGDLVEGGLIVEEGMGRRGGKVDVGLEEIGGVAANGGVELGGWARWCRAI